MGFHRVHTYFPTLTMISHTRAFLHDTFLDPYIRRFVRPFGHSHHRYFIDPRHIGDTSHLWDAFVWIRDLQLRSLSADFTELQTIKVSLHIACRSLRGSISGRYSFHSTPQSISSVSFKRLPLFHLFRLVVEQVARTQRSSSVKLMGPSLIS